MQETASTVSQLGIKTTQISEFIGIIAGNESAILRFPGIEAARAGEAGRGFAVVAEEVRKLAEESNDAASSITKLVKDIEVEMQTALQAMERSDTEVSDGAEKVNRTSSMLGEIVGGVQALSDKVQNISAAAEEINAATTEVVDTIDTIGSRAEQSAAAAEEVSAATEEQTASMEEIGANANNLASQAQELQEMISKFKV